MFQKDDLVIMTEYGILKLIMRSNPHYKKLKSTLFKVTSHYNRDKIEVERMNGNRFPALLPVDYFRFATPKEIKLQTIKKIFI